MGKGGHLIMDETALRAEANRVNYRLRSTFFYRKLKEYNTLSFPSLVEDLLCVKDLYSWQDRKLWGIGEEAFAYINTHSELQLLQVFCHPKLLREQPRLLAYYRNIAALSQKSVKYLVNIDVKKVESDLINVASLNPSQALNLSTLFNEHITLIVDASIQTLSKDELHALLLTSTGSQIDGSWRNAIGEEAEKLVKRLLVNEAKERNLLGALIPRVGTSVEPYDPTSPKEQNGNIHKYRGILLTNQTSIVFSSDPDISFFDASGNTACVVEIKGGQDPAGALERYGAAKKSFEKARSLTPDVPTILVASCITSEVHTRIRQDPLITSYYNLTELLSESSGAYDQFMSDVFSRIGVN